VVPSAKLLAASNLFGPILGNSPNPGTDEEKKHWYTNRPAEALSELYELINIVKNALEDGISLPPGPRLKVFKSKRDGAADPVGALLLYKGLRHSDGSRIEAEMVDSKLHVFTRLQGRPNYSAADVALQEKTFAEILDRVSGRTPLPPTR
jgi:carboxylesterase